MIALDSTVLARLVTNDDAQQGHQAVQLIDSREAFFVPLTVSLELEWILRSLYKLEVNTIANAFEGLMSIRNLSFQNDADLSAALALYLKGMDFAGALHLVSSKNCERLMTFDMRFAQAAKRAASAQEVKLIVS